MRVFISRSSLDASPELLPRFLQAAAKDAEFLRGSYPGFDAWIQQKVVPGIQDGDRTAVLEMRGGAVAGLLIVKHSPAEKKLCTLRVRPEYESLGLGVRLFETAFDLLDTRRPLLSVSENTRPKFARLFDYFGFCEEAAYQGLYLPRVQEFSYNGLIAPDTYALSSRVAGRSHFGRLGEPSLFPWLASRRADAAVV